MTVSPAGNVAKFTPKIECFGYHDVTLTMKDGDATWTERRSLALLQPDTRERGDWQPGRGPSFGFWDWAGGHDTPQHAVQLERLRNAIGRDVKLERELSARRIALGRQNRED